MKKRSLVIIIVCFAVIAGIIVFNYSEITGQAVRRTNRLPNRCTDNDNTRIRTNDASYFRASYVDYRILGKWKQAKDSCSSNGKNLNEKYCGDFGNLRTKIVRCENGCESGACRELPKFCNPLRYSGEIDNKINIVFVPSNFNGDMKKFETKVKEIWNQFEKYTPFKSDIKELNAFYVTKESELTDGNFCEYVPEDGIFVLCNPLVAKYLSRNCVKGIHETIVVNNVEEYGGGGYFWPVNLHIAAVNIDTNPDPHYYFTKVAVHELSHILFGFGDEYYALDSPYSTDETPNCDVAGCPKWKDLITGGFKNVGCYADRCSNGEYYASKEETIMNDYGSFSSAQERTACCVYKARTGNYPPSLCSKFNAKNLISLNEYCAKYPVSKSLLTEDYGEKSLQEAEWHS